MDKNGVLFNTLKEAFFYHTSQFSLAKYEVTRTH